MPVIGHHAVSEHAHRRLSPRLLKQANKRVVVAIHMEQGLPPRAAIEHVKYVACLGETWSSRHRLSKWRRESLACSGVDSESGVNRSAAPGGRESLATAIVPNGKCVDAKDSRPRSFADSRFAEAIF